MWNNFVADFKNIFNPKYSVSFGMKGHIFPKFQYEQYKVTTFQTPRACSLKNIRCGKPKNLNLDLHNTNIRMITS
jgi:hypothetical protein